MKKYVEEENQKWWRRETLEGKLKVKAERREIPLFYVEEEWKKASKRERKSISSIESLEEKRNMKLEEENEENVSMKKYNEEENLWL